MNKTVKNSMIYLLGTIITGLLGLGGTAVLTRSLTYETYLMYSILVKIHTAIVMVASLGYDASYMRFYYEHSYSQIRYMFECIKYPAIVCIAVTAAFALPGQWTTKLVFGETLSLIAIISVIIYIILSFLHRFTQITARMEEKATNYVLSNLVAKSGFLVVIMIVYMLYGVVSFDWVTTSLAMVAVASVLINLLVIRKIQNCKNESGREISQTEIFAYGIPNVVNSAVLSIMPLAEVFIIRHLAGEKITSIFAAAGVFQTVILMLVNTLINIWNPIVYKHCENEKKFKPILHTFGLAGTMILTIGTALCILLRRWLVLILDESYFSVYVIAPAMLLAACFNILSTIYSVGINIKKKTGHLIIGPILQVITSVVLCYLLIPKLGLVGVGISVLASVGVSRTYRTVIGLRLYNTGQNEAKAVMLILASIICAVIALFKTSLYDDILLSVSLLAVAAIIINKEAKKLINTVLVLIKPAKKTNVEERNEKNSAF